MRSVTSPCRAAVMPVLMAVVGFGLGSPAASACDAWCGSRYSPAYYGPPTYFYSPPTVVYAGPPVYAYYSSPSLRRYYGRGFRPAGFYRVHRPYRAYVRGPIVRSWRRW